MEDLKPIRVFLEVAERNSFAGAARALRMTPASVTRIISRLEEALGQQLLVRTTRRVALTSAGALVAARYRPVVEAFDRVTADITRASLPDRGRLRINAPMSMGLRLLPRLIDGFRLTYPHIALDIQMTDTLIDIMEEECDLSIRISGPPADKSTIWRKLCEVPRHAIAAPEFLDRLLRPASPDDLVPAHCLSYSANGHAEEWVFTKGATRRVFRAGAGVISNNGDFLYEIVRSGGGIAVLPDFIVAQGIAEGAVERLMPDWHVTPLWLTLFYPPYEQLPPLVKTFTDFFETHLRKINEMDFSRMMR